MKKLLFFHFVITMLFSSSSNALQLKFITAVQGYQPASSLSMYQWSNENTSGETFTLQDAAFASIHTGSRNAGMGIEAWGEYIVVAYPASSTEAQLDIYSLTDVSLIASDVGRIKISHGNFGLGIAFGPDGHLYVARNSGYNFGQIDEYIFIYDPINGGSLTSSNENIFIFNTQDPGYKIGFTYLSDNIFYMTQTETTNAQGYTRLDTYYFQKEPSPSFTLTQSGIAYIEDPNSGRGFGITFVNPTDTIPEPSTIILMLSGLIPLINIFQRRS